MTVPIAHVAGCMLVSVFTAVLFAEFLAPYSPDQQHRTVAYSPPTSVYVRDEHNRFTRPFVYATTNTPAASPGSPEALNGKSAIRFFVRDTGGRLHLFGVDEPAVLFVMGSDESGRDVLSRLLYGGRQSFLMSIISALLALSTGVLLGGVAGYFGGWADQGVIALADLFLSVPWLYFLLGVRASLPLRLDYAHTFAAMVLALAVIGWARPARLVRGVVLRARESDYTRAAMGFGASDWYLLRKHVLPETERVIAVQACLLIPGYIVAEASLSYFGLGIADPDVSWGSLLVPLQHYDVMVSCWWMWLPAGFLVIVTGCFFAINARFRE